MSALLERTTFPSFPEPFGPREYLTFDVFNLNFNSHGQFEDGTGKTEQWESRDNDYSCVYGPKSL